MLILFKTILVKELTIFRRYSFNMLSAIISISLLFLLIFLGIKTIAKDVSTGTVEGIIVGFFIWTYSILSYSSLSSGITDEAKSGTLEQLYMSPYGFLKISYSMVISSYIISLVFTVPILIFMMVLTGRYLNIDIISLLPLLILTTASGFGLGYITGGLGLLYKKIQSLFQILQFAFIAFISAPVEKFQLFKVLPFSLGTNLIMKNMSHRIPIWNMNYIDLIYLVLNAVFYLSLGILIFKICERKAKTKGSIGHY